ncbi:uncharacterized protein LOC119993348 [Tripterygium wilfordii]|uniref:uncharacterized protein LOC119993348 n=1 Tax=Tripterygium wilfordii TaxID=458696 RepID=UPI0018F83C76|nr:uncharacterized protein LOC119993348 [Tripterygium wilfordii]
MAGSTLVSRLSTRLGSLSLNLNKSITKSVLPTISPSKSSSEFQVSSSLKRLSRDSRLPVQLSCLVSMVPLHDAIASARLTSMLSAESQSWGLTPQGISMPL